MKTLLSILLTLLAFGLPSLSAGAVPGRPAISMDGEWRFQLDARNEGESGRWYETGTRFADTIRVPGHWAVQGFGAETKEAKHSHHAPAWYAREVTVPADWAGRRIFFRCGGVYRYLKLWVNGQVYDAPPHSYTEALAWDITPLVNPGQTNRLVLRVDPVQQPGDPLMGAGWDMAEFLPIPFFGGGIWGHVSLEARSERWMDGLAVRPKFDPRGVRVIVELNRRLDPEGAATAVISDGDGRELARQTWSQKTFGVLPVLHGWIPLPEAALWSPETPNLLTCRVELRGANGQVLDQREERFGLREIKIDGHKILLNGRRIMLHGYGEGANYPDPILPPVDKAFYRERLAAARALGFNAVRHHSHALPEEYLEACDELGFLVQYELPIAYETYFRKAAENPVALDTYRRTWRAMVRRYRNHPSVFAWCMGNELYGYPTWNWPVTRRNAIDIAAELYAVAKDEDPTRPVIDSDGLDLPMHKLDTPDAPHEGQSPNRDQDFANGVFDRGTLDFHTPQFKWGLPLELPNRYGARDLPPVKPLIAHEDLNHFTFPRLNRVLDGYNGVVKMTWFEEARGKLRERGQLEESEIWAANSERLVEACMKMEWEALRRNPHWSGYHFWMLYDYWTACDGLFDIRFQRKPAPRDEIVQRLNASLLVTQTGFPETTAVGGKDVTVRFPISNFTPESLPAGRLQWRMEAAGLPVLKGEVNASTLPQGEVTEAGSVTFSLPAVTAITKATLHVTLHTGSTTVSNDWTCRLYPSETARPDFAMPLFADDSLGELPLAWGAKPMPKEEPYPTHAVYVTERMTPALAQAVEGGASLLWVRPQASLPFEVRNYVAGWWDGSCGQMGNTGTRVLPVAPDFIHALAPEGWLETDWHSPHHQAHAYQLDDWPQQPRLLIRSIDRFRRLANLALLCDFRVGRGHVVLSGFDLAGPGSDPMRSHLLARLMEFAATPADHLPELPPAFLLSQLVDGPPNPPRAGCPECAKWLDAPPVRKAVLPPDTSAREHP